MVLLGDVCVFREEIRQRTKKTTMMSDGLFYFVVVLLSAKLFSTTTTTTTRIPMVNTKEQNRNFQLHNKNNQQRNKEKNILEANANTKNKITIFRKMVDNEN